MIFIEISMKFHVFTKQKTNVIFKVNFMKTLVGARDGRTDGRRTDGDGWRRTETEGASGTHTMTQFALIVHVRTQFVCMLISRATSGM